MLLTPYIYGLFTTRPLHTVAEALPTIVLPQLIEKIQNSNARSAG